MSDEPGENGGESGQASGNRPRGGQPRGGQPQGGTPQDGEPQDGEPQGGMPQGGEPSQAYQTGPGMGDIFRIPETLSAIKAGAAVYGIFAIGIAIIATGMGTFVTDGAFNSVMTGYRILFTEVVLGAAPLLALVLGFRHADVLEDQPNNVLFATTAVSNAVGVLAVYVIGAIFAFAAASATADPGQAVGDALLPVVLVMIGVAVVSAGTAWTVRAVTPGNGAASTAPEARADASQDRETGGS